MIAAVSPFMHDALHRVSSDLIAGAQAFGILILHVVLITIGLYGAIWLLGRCTPSAPAPEKVEDDL